MRHGILCVLLALIPVAGGAQERPVNVTEAEHQGESPVNVTEVDTRDVQLYYYNYLSDLAPLTIRTFTNARNWQRRMFGWEPSERTTVLLQDFVDYGNAHAAAAPRGQLVVDVAPNSRAFETAPSSERMYSTMNHELVHVVQSDIASKEDLRWRRFFLGKVSAQSQYPETLLYSYLTIPRFTTPRWYSEGGAVFLETWMAGGFGRAQGGYDEMVFRAMVRDDAHFYDPLGLVSRGTQGRLPDRRECLPLRHALLHVARLRLLAGEGRRLDPAQRGQQALLRRPVRARVRPAAGKGVAGVDRVRARVPAEEPGRGAQVPDHADAQARRGCAGLGFAPLLRRGAAPRCTARSAIPASSSTSARSTRGPAACGAWPTSRARCTTWWPRSRTTRKSGTAFYTNDNNALRDLMAVDVKTGESRMLLENASIGEIVFNPVDRSLIGVRHLYGRASLVRIAHPYDDWTTLYRFPWEHVPSDLDISPDGKLLSATMNDEKGEQYLRVWELAKVLRGDLKPMRESQLRAVGARELRVHGGRPLPLRQQLLHRRVQHLPLRGGHRRGGGGVERGDRALPSRAARGRAARRAHLHRRGLRPRGHRPQAAGGRRARSASWAPKSRRSIRW